jgi:hypothetical protein
MGLAAVLDPKSVHQNASVSVLHIQDCAFSGEVLGSDDYATHQESVRVFSPGAHGLNPAGVATEIGWFVRAPTGPLSRNFVGTSDGKWMILVELHT